MKNRIYLIGYMGTGKTTLGKRLAAAYGYKFVDIDHYIQEKYGKTIAELFEKYGEDGFRQIEKNILKETATLENTVIAAGGGTPCFFDNMEFMNDSGTTIYLKASPEALNKRLCIPEHKAKRPLIRDKNETELLEFITENLMKREPFYTKAQIIFETDKLISRDDIDSHVEHLKKLLA